MKIAFFEIYPNTKRGAAPSAQRDNSPRYGVGVEDWGYKLIYNYVYSIF
jgi:hypothetical protein